MLYPFVCDPRDLLKPGQELDTEHEYSCLCGNPVKLGACKLVYLDCGDGEGWRVCCNQTCYVFRVRAGEA